MVILGRPSKGPAPLFIVYRYYLHGPVETMTLGMQPPYDVYLQAERAARVWAKYSGGWCFGTK
jgi:hypothetical protein